MKDYKYRRGDYGTELTLKPNNPSKGPSANALYLSLGGGRESTAIMDRKSIEEFVYAAAVHGGLIEEGQSLIIKAPKREVPEDGAYYLSTGASQCLAVIENGRLYVPQRNGSAYTGYMVDLTDNYTQEGSGWTLKKMQKG